MEVQIVMVGLLEDDIMDYRFKNSKKQYWLILLTVVPISLALLLYQTDVPFLKTGLIVLDVVVVIISLLSIRDHVVLEVRDDMIVYNKLFGKKEVLLKEVDSVEFSGKSLSVFHLLNGSVIKIPTSELNDRDLNLFKSLFE